MGHDVGLAIAAVDDDGQAAPGQLQVQIEPFLLLRKRSPFPVPVQSRLTNGGNGRQICQIDDPGPVTRNCLGDVVWLNSHRGEDTLV